jgi:hypothetical protein
MLQRGLPQLLRFRQVSPTAALSAIVARRAVFLGDTDHDSMLTQVGLIELRDLLGGAGKHRDSCHEMSPLEYRGLRDAIRHVKYFMRRDKRFMAPAFLLCDRPARLMEMMGFDINSRSGLNDVPTLSGLFGVSLAQRQGLRTHTVDYDDKLTEANRPSSDMARLARDPEVAANIWYATKTRPFMVTYGAGHMERGGLPSHFERDERVVVLVYESAAVLEQEILQEQFAPPRLRKAVSPRDRGDFLYLAQEAKFLQRKDFNP